MTSPVSLSSQASMREWHAGELSGRTFECNNDLPKRLCPSLDEKALVRMARAIHSRRLVNHQHLDQTNCGASSNCDIRVPFVDSNDDGRVAAEEAYEPLANLWNHSVAAYHNLLESAERQHSQFMVPYVARMRHDPAGVSGLWLTPSLIIPINLSSFAFTSDSKTENDLTSDGEALEDRYTSIDEREKKKERLLSWGEVAAVCEVRDRWTDIFSWAADDARALFLAHPARSFVAVVGFNHITFTFRFLFFHRSGLTISPLLELVDREKGKWRGSDVTVFVKWVACLDELCSGRLRWDTSAQFSNDHSLSDPTSSSRTLSHFPTVPRIVNVRSSLSDRSTRVTALFASDDEPDMVMSPDSTNDKLSVLPSSSYKDTPSSDSSDSQPVSEVADSESSDGAQRRKRLFERVLKLDVTRHAAFLADIRTRVHIQDLNTENSPARYPVVVVKESWPVLKEGKARHAETEGRQDTTAEELDDAPYEPQILVPLRGQFGLPQIVAWHVVDTTEAFRGIPCTLTKTTDARVRQWVTRARLVTYYATYGSLLYDVPSPRALVEAVYHAMIGESSHAMEYTCHSQAMRIGYRIMLERGYMHLDISVGNILWLPKPERRANPEDAYV